MPTTGDKIHGSVKKDEVAQYEGLIGEGESKLMANFIVTQSCGQYRTTPHPYKIVFLPTTKVKNCEDLPRNLTGFNPVNYKDLMSGNLDGDYLVGKFQVSCLFVEVFENLFHNDSTENLQ
ncbi:hypothetical protein Rs2_10820 [Raphanus sativus]|nr:hypothetical protein Rs2_10820 [Raphanus sativus]